MGNKKLVPPAFARRDQTTYVLSHASRALREEKRGHGKPATASILPEGWR